MLKFEYSRGDMRTTYFRFFSLLMIGGLILSACNMPGSNTAAETTPPTSQSVANTAVPIEATSTPTEIAPTETPTATATETLTPEPSSTSTPEIPKAEVNRESNCRVGPGGQYDLVATYQAGQKLEVVAKDLGNGFLFVKNPDKPEDQCYLLAQNITVTGDLSALPKFTPQPSPTLAPDFKATFKKFGVCNGENYAIFDVVNIGSATFSSSYIKVTNTKLKKFVEQVDAFDLHVGCVLAKAIYPLDPGGSGYVTSSVFKWSGTGDLQVVIMLCAEKGLKGACVTQSMPIKE
ncbi:MAG: hypothetical protein ABI904_06560 [Chloroflexota bacterium]